MFWFVYSLCFLCPCSFFLLIITCYVFVNRCLFHYKVRPMFRTQINSSCRTNSSWLAEISVYKHNRCVDILGYNLIQKLFESVIFLLENISHLHPLRYAVNTLIQAQRPFYSYRILNTIYTALWILRENNNNIVGARS